MKAFTYPTFPSRLSNKFGASDLMYVQVHISNNITVSKL